MTQKFASLFAALVKRVRKIKFSEGRFPDGRPTYVIAGRRYNDLNHLLKTRRIVGIARKTAEN